MFTSFTPTEAAVGQEISIMGTGFSAGSNNQVSFGGSGFNADATLTGESGGVQTLTVRVHKNAVNGKIQVQAFGSTTTSQNDFTRIDHTVTTFTPTAFKPEDEVTITGTNFSTVVADNEVCFGGRCVAAASVNTNGTELKVSAPQVTSQQTSTLKVKIGPVSINAPGTFTLDPIIPIVMTNFEPKVVRMGDEITITGSGFTQEADATLSGSDNVYLPQHSAEIYDMNESGTEMKMRISYSVRDIEATLIAVVTRKCIGMCDTPNRIYSFSGLPGLTVTATPPLSITNFTPTSARVGEEITITGTGFSLYAAHNFIEFAGVRPANAPSAHYVNNDGTELKVRVHPDARTGDISVFYLGSAFFTFDRELTVNQPTPVVNDDFMPTSGGPGREVTINGENFALFAEYNEVSFAYSSNASFTSQFVTAHWVNEDGTQLRAIIGDDPYPTTPPGTPALPDLPIGVRIGDDGTVSTSTATFNIDLSDVVSPPPPPATPSPIVSSFMPEMGAVGTNVTITGQNFSDTPEENTITFGGGVEAGVPSSASTTSLTVNVPSGATTGPITVTVSGQTGTSQSTFTVSGSQPPTPPGTPSPIVSSFMPSMGAVGEAVVITGQNFSDTPEENTVTFGGGVDATPSASTTTSLTVQVPQNAVTGPITVTVSGQTGTSQSTFTVPGTQPPPPPGTPAPIVSSFLPNMGAVGTPVTITGQNFSDVPAENTITFGGGVEAGVPSSATTTSLTVNVPQNAVTGPITVTVSGQTGTSSTHFTVPGTDGGATLSVTNIRPTSASVGDMIKISGLGFSTTPSENVVVFNGDAINQTDNVETTPLVADATFLDVEVPSGAKTGPISVKIGGSIAVSGQIFTVEAGIFGTTISESTISVYPNPTSGELYFVNLSHNSTYMYKIYSLLGQQIERGVLQNDSSIDLSSLSEGQYVLVLQVNDSEVLRTRLLVLK